MYKSPLCKRLKEVRKRKGLSQKKLGMMAGMSEESASGRMNHYETGRHVPTYETLKSIAKAVKLSVAYFYAENDKLAECIASFKLRK